ncbi:MAG TPA: T9SS type A sorting domain-containing protein [Bacteroidales bacterium]
MKQRLIFIIFAVLINCSVFGQEFVSSDKQWNVRLNGGIGLTTEIFQIDGDSIVDSKSYNKIWLSYDSLTTVSFQGLLREESNIVYYIPPDFSEGILYDFNLEIGDTTSVINIFCGSELIPIHVIDIDTVEYFGESRKRWLIGENGNIEEIWVEGIGSLNGPLYTKYWYCIVCPVWELLCYHKNDTLEYIMPGETECYQNTVGIEELTKKDKILIRPNPVKKGNSIEIVMSFKPVNVDIINFSGILIQRLTSIQDQIIKIETNELEKGLYIIKVTNQENKIQTLKILIE